MLDGVDADAIAEAIVLDGTAPLAATGAAARAARFSIPPRADELEPRPAWHVEQGGAAGVFFDLASLTKSMTAVAIVRARIDPRATLGSFVSELADTASGSAPLELLLAHRAGLESHAPLYEPMTRGEPVDRREALRTAADARRADARGPYPSAGFAPLYSDLGYALVGEALARATGARDAGEAISRLVADPLGLGAQLGTARDLKARGVDIVRDSAPTEDVPWRGGMVRGRVHDENAWALTGLGGSGHAGIFGTVGAVLAFGMGVLDALEGVRSPLSLAGAPSAYAWLVAPRPGGTLRAGFDGKSEEGSSAGTLASPRTFGHLGFTGTSLWIDPDVHAVVTLLTNRVHPTRDNVAIRAARPRAHDALFARARSLVPRGPLSR